MPKPELLLPLPGPVRTSKMPCSLSALAMRSCMIFCLAAIRLAWRSGSLIRSCMGFFLVLIKRSCSVVAHRNKHRCAIDFDSDEFLLIQLLKCSRLQHAVGWTPAGIAIGVQQ